MGFACPPRSPPRRRTRTAVAVAITGDEGIAYNGRARDRESTGRPASSSIVLNDASLSLIRIKLEANGAPGSALDLRETDFATLARGFGCAGEIARTPQELADAVDGALARERSTVIDARLAGSEYGALLKVIRG